MPDARGLFERLKRLLRRSPDEDDKDSGIGVRVPVKPKPGALTASVALEEPRSEDRL